MLSLKLWKSIFLIVGTAIGAGILALPISTVHAGYIGSTVGLLICWFFMTVAAYFLLDVRLQFKKDIDLSTMTLETLGKVSQNGLKVFYLLLLFALVCVYIIVGSAWVQELLGISSSFIVQLGFTVVMATLIYMGIGSVATANHVITTLMLLTLIFIVGLSTPYVQIENLTALNTDHILPTFPLLLTAFGFSIVMPSLVPYLDYDRKSLTLSLIIGSIIIIMAYFLWEMIAFGVIGDTLEQFANSQDKGTEVIQSLSQMVHQSIFNKVGSVFMFTAILSSFIGVGQCLFHYLKDILPVENVKKRSLFSIIFGFAIPFAVIQIYPAGVTKILSHAGIFVAIILGILPSAMILASNKSSTFKGLAWLTTLFFCGVIALELIG